MYLNLFERYWTWVGKYHMKLEAARMLAAAKKAEKERKENFLANFKMKYPDAYVKFLANSGDRSKERLYNEKLNDIFFNAIESGLVKALKSEYYCMAKFNNGTKIKFWISNKWYAYAQNSTVFWKEGDEIEYKDFGNQQMPEFMIKFLIHSEVEKKAHKAELHDLDLKEF